VIPRLDPGDPVFVSTSGVAGGPCVRARVRESEGRLITLRCPEAPFTAGDILKLEIVVPGDAHYAVEARLRSYRDRILNLDPLGSWSREQRRDYYRVRTGAIPVQALRDLSHRSERDSRFRTVLYDLSASGAQLETDLSLEEDERLLLKFALQRVRLEHVLAIVDEDPEEPALEVDVTGTVVRVNKLSTGRKRRVGIRFSGVSPVLRQQLLHWIYAFQSQRRAQELVSDL
jgi:PilZ domain